MSWKFKLCTAVFDKRVQVLEHYRLHHANVSSISPLPCPHDDCICTFQSINALKIHLTQLHTQTAVHSANHMECVSSICSVCGLKQLLSDKTLLSHLRTHLNMRWWTVHSEIVSTLPMSIPSLMPTKIGIVQMVLSQILRTRSS